MDVKYYYLQEYEKEERNRENENAQISSEEKILSIHISGQGNREKIQWRGYLLCSLPMLFQSFNHMVSHATRSNS